MSDQSYNFQTQNPDGTKLEDTVIGSFGLTTLYCKHDCCGDSKDPTCCIQETPDDTDAVETYQLVSLIAAGIAGLCMISVALLCVVKQHMKKRRLIRDVNSLNKTNNKKDINKIKVAKYQKGIGQNHAFKKDEKLFKKSKKSSFRPSTPTILPSATKLSPIASVATTPPQNPLPSVMSTAVYPNGSAHFDNTIPSPPAYTDVLFQQNLDYKVYP